VNFGSAYGCEAPKLQELLVTDLNTATKMLDAKLAKFSGYEPGKRKWKETHSDRLCATKLGGRRHLREAILSDDKWKQQSAARQASNFEIQSAGAELAKKAMSRIWDSGIFFNLDAVFIAVIHDEVVWSVHRDDAYESIKVVWEAVSQPYTPDFPVPFIGSISLSARILGSSMRRERSRMPTL
jgi:DNA polymerase-1